GVWLFFENSTGCLISQCQLFYTPDWSGFGLSGWDSFGNTFVARTLCPTKFLLESLILAQDERWRRA
ncbi:hypothetical protein, partial [Micromonospora sp. NPDC049240]|uniref:hypothetical protein n=1 Tax=Micromonospora sp. NPDC049240 TaxID=3155151 RepID=UPI0033C0E179